MAKKEITFEEICRDITARKFQPVYVLMGEEPFLHRSNNRFVIKKRIRGI